MPPDRRRRYPGQVWTTGVDLSETSIRLAHSKGLEVRVANGRRLPVPDGTFAAAWTMSTLLHVPNTRIHDVVGELVRATAPGAPIAIGLWSGDDDEVLNPEDLDQPRRFFSRRRDATARRIFGEHGEVVDFETCPEVKGIVSGPGAGQWTQHYQFLVLHTPRSPEGVDAGGRPPESLMDAMSSQSRAAHMGSMTHPNFLTDTQARIEADPEARFAVSLDGSPTTKTTFGWAPTWSAPMSAAWTLNPCRRPKRSRSHGCAAA
ncbi:class I SAM-dependent methyltransferase [Arthrobacter sp. UYEF3]|uniref:class I SAM-dependent methyltransferase n=1 Tax=Arthrobacter sp. UYEF3 TaxID=1756365 RepID=UPI003392F5BB